MMHSAFSWLVVLLSSAAGFMFVHTVILKLRVHYLAENGRRFLIGEAVDRSTIRVGFLVLGAIIGYASHDLQQYYHSHTINDVIITDVQDDTHMLMRAMSRPMDVGAPVVWCERQPQFRPGVAFQSLTFWDQRDCWSITWFGLNKKLGYIVYPEIEHPNVRLAGR